MRENNPSYSNRAFARDVGLSPAFVSDILNGKKPLPYKHVETFIRVLDMDQADSGFIKKSFAPEELLLELPERAPEKSAQWLLGSRLQMQILTKWYYLPMIDLCTCEGFDGDFSKVLGLNEEQVSEATELLLKLELIEATSDGFKKTQNKLHFTSAKSQAEFRKFHAQMMMKAIEEMDITDEERFQRRLLIGFSLALNSSKVAGYKKQLSDLIYQMIDEMSDDHCDQIYHLGIQFFPLSKPLPKK